MRNNRFVQFFHTFIIEKRRGIRYYRDNRMAFLGKNVIFYESFPAFSWFSEENN